MTQNQILTYGIPLYLIFIIFLIKRLVKDLKTPIIEWNDKNEFPTNIREDRNISEDILIIDLDTNNLYIGYYSFLTDRWIIINKTGVVNNFNWAYLNN